MLVFVNKDFKIIVQGFIGKEGLFYVGQMIEYGINVVGGVMLGKGGQEYLGKLVFNIVVDVVKDVGVDIFVIFVFFVFVGDVIMEVVDVGIKVIICIMEGILVQDMVKVKAYIKDCDCCFIGFNCLGIIILGEVKCGIMFGFIYNLGCIGIVFCFGILMYEVVDQVIKVGMG